MTYISIKYQWDREIKNNWLHPQNFARAEAEVKIAEASSGLWLRPQVRPPHLSAACDSKIGTLTINVDRAMMC